MLYDIYDHVLLDIMLQNMGKEDDFGVFWANGTMLGNAGQCFDRPCKVNATQAALQHHRMKFAELKILREKLTSSYQEAGYDGCRLSE